MFNSHGELFLASIFIFFFGVLFIMLICLLVLHLNCVCERENEGGTERRREEEAQWDNDGGAKAAKWEIGATESVFTSVC